MNSLLSSCVVFVFFFSCSEQTNFLNKDYISSINSVAKTWKAGINFHPENPLKFILGLLGSKSVEVSSAGPFKSHDLNCTTMPEVFRKNLMLENDGRTVRRSGRFAIKAIAGLVGGKKTLKDNGHTRFSEFNVPSRGCQLPHIRKILKILVICYGCQPYMFPPCAGSNSCSGQSEKNHKCQKQCYGNASISYKDDLRYVKGSPYVLAYDNIQNDIMTYGPIESSFDVYDDFISYKSGVYSKSPNAKYLGGHSVKCIGWGVERNVPYWLMMNSWNNTWGDGGYFKIRRGKKRVPNRGFVHCWGAEIL